MQTAAEISMCAILGVIAWQDLRERLISWYLLPMLLLAAIGMALTQLRAEEWLRHLGTNVLLLLLQLAVVAVYYYAKHRHLRFMDQALGWGDVLLVLVLCTLFSPLNFLSFYSAGSLFCLLAYLIYTWLSGSRNKEVPLAGGLSLGMILLLLARHIREINLYDDRLLLSLIK